MRWFGGSFEAGGLDPGRADAWLNEIDIAPPHLLDWKADQAVRIVVTESRMTASSS